MDTLPEVAEQEETVLDLSIKYDKSDSVQLDIPDGPPVVSDGEENIDEDDDAIFFTINNQARETDNLVDDVGSDGYLPALPSYSDQSTHLSRYSNQPIVDYSQPKTLSERVKEDLLEAKRWRSFSIESAGADEPQSLDGTPPMSGVNPETELKIRSPWTDSPSSPPRSYLNEMGSGGPRVSTRERTYSIETGF